MNEQKVMKDGIGLNDPVSITQPAHVWLGFIGAYGSTNWHSEDASAINREVLNQLLDPLFRKEKEAAISEHLEQHGRPVIQRFIIGEPPAEDDAI